MSKTKSVGSPVAQNRIKDLWGPRLSEHLGIDWAWQGDRSSYCVSVHELGHLFASIGAVQVVAGWETAAWTLIGRLRTEHRIDDIYKHIAPPKLGRGTTSRHLEQPVQCLSLQTVTYYVAQPPDVHDESINSRAERGKETMAYARAKAARAIAHTRTQCSLSPNTALLAALQEVDKIQQEMNPTKVSPTQEYLEEARSGAMYGYRDSDDPEPDHD